LLRAIRSGARHRHEPRRQPFLERVLEKVDTGFSRKRAANKETEQVF